MNKVRAIVYVILQGCWLLAYPQSHQIQFDHLGIADGLSQSYVQCIVRDSRGFMWFGTPNGLNKYDGYSFTVYYNDPSNPRSLANNFVMDIVESKNGDLWVATLGGGLSRYDRKKELFTTYRHDPANNNSLSNDYVNHLAEDENGNLWIATEAGLNLFDPGKNTFEHFTNDARNQNSLSDSYIRCVFKDSHQNLWVCTMNGGLNLFDRTNKTFTRFEHNKNNNRSIAGNNVITMFEDSKQRLWIGTDGNGIDQFEPKTGTFYHYRYNDNNPLSLSANAVYAINEDADNNLWVGTENGGLSILDHVTGLFTTYKNDEIDKESLSNNSIYAIYKDRKNNMWLGNFAGGIDIANRDKLKFTHYKHMMLTNSLSNNNVLTIKEDTKKNVWIGTDGGGLNLFDPKQQHFTHFRHQKNNKQSICGDYVLTICEDSKGNIWTGTWGNGVSVYNTKNKTFSHYKNDPGNPASLSNNNIYKIFEDREKNIWIGTIGAGLNLLNPDHRSFTHYRFNENQKDGISADNIQSIFEDSNGELWICTDGGGLDLFNKKTNTFSRFLHDDTRNSISNNSVCSVFEDGNKNFWICTRRGLNKYNKRTGLFTVYTMPDGLPDNTVFGVLEDSKKNLWISTNRGISCFNPVTKVFTNFDASDGLQSNEFKEQAFCKSSSGMMYFGGNNGFNQFLPDSIKAIPFEPPLVITNFLVFNKRVPAELSSDKPSPLKQSITETRSITLPYSSSVLSFEFATLNFTSPEKKQYAYMLEGFDKHWNEAGTARMATYTNLDPATYVFKVKGLNNEGKWSTNIVTVQLIIEPPFWLTWWFRLIIIILAVALIVGIYRFRLKNIRAQQLKLEQQVQEQTLQLVQSAEEEYKARAEAEKANQELKIKNKELEQFAYVASHDLQEPLRTTASFVELLQKQYQGKLDEKADKYLNFISDASGRMKVLIKDLLDFSRIGKNGVLEKVDCNLVIKDLLADIMAAIKESGADIQYAVLPVIQGYPTEIKLLFQNLLINAIKFRRKDAAPCIHIAAEEVRGSWQFSVSDNGIGIAAEHGEKIFDIFQRLHTRDEYAGSGIGLSHCKKIVELHHGKIWVESVPGKGSTFYFTLNRNKKVTTKN